MIGDGAILNDLVALKEREEEKLPDEYDIKGSSMSFLSIFLLILYSFYPNFDKVMFFELLHRILINLDKT